MNSNTPRVLKPPAPLRIPDGHRSVFLAGSIDMGSADDWQADMARALADLDNLLVLNPRRDAWDSSWSQSIDNPLFRGQVEWELNGLERADVVAMMLLPDSQAPISLLELGLFAPPRHASRSSKCIVCCPSGFWRKGNVDVVCQRYGVEQVPDLASLASAVRRRLAQLDATP